MTTKYFTKETLIMANDLAIKTNRNRTLEPKAIKKLDADGLKFPVVFSMIHNDHEMRVQIALGAWQDGEPKQIGTAFLDIPFETYETLPSVETK
jgi:hypothetical protein